MVVGVLLAALGAGRAVAAGTQTRPAAWSYHDMIVDLHDLPKRYACDDLWYKFRDILLTIGARPNMEIIPYQCNSFSPRVQIRFWLPEAVSGSQASFASLQADQATVRLEPGHPRSLDASDCALLQQVKGTLLAALPVRVVSYRFTCGAPPSTHRSFQVSVEALTAAPKGQREVVAHRGWPVRPASGARPAHNA
jgi:hypothetical protein